MLNKMIGSILVPTAGFTPASVSGLWAWYEASKLTGLSDGDRLASFTDQSGNGRHATAAGAARPFYRTNIINGLPAIDFVPDACTMTLPVFTSVELFIVLCVYNRDAGGSVWLGSSGNSNNFLYSTLTTVLFSQPTTGGGSAVAGAALNTWHIAGGSRTALGVSRSECNGAQGTTTTDIAAASLDTFGYPSTPSFNIDGYVLGGALYTTEPSAGDKTRIRQYFANQVGIVVI